MFARKFPSFGKSLFKPSPRARRAMVLPQAGRRPQLFCALMALRLFLGMAAQAKAQYMYTTIDVPGSTETEAYGINAHGQIVGLYDAGDTTHGFLLSNGSYTTLDVDVPGATDTEAPNAPAVRRDIPAFRRKLELP